MGVNESHPVAAPVLTVSTQDAKKHFAGNALSNICFFLFNIATSFFMVPYQLRNLGVANYGTVTLAYSFTLYTQVLTVALTSTLFRFVTVHIARGDVDEARKYFNTQIIAIAWFVGIFLPLGLTISYYAPSFVRIPSGEEWNTRILFAAMYLSFLTALVGNPLRVAQFAGQRFDLGNWTNIAGQVVRYSTWIVMFGVMVPLTWHIGLGFLMESVIVLIASAVIFKRLLPQLRPSLRHFDKQKFFDMTKMGTWMTVNQVGAILYLSIDVLIINRLLGPTSAGRYGLILGIAMMLRGLSGTMSGMMTPLAVSSYANNDHKSMARQMARAVRLTSLGMGIPLAIVCGVAIPFLGWWLGPECKILYPLVWWLLAHQVITCGVEPLHSVSVAANKLTVPALFTIGGGVTKVVLSIVLIRYTSLGMYGVAIAGFCAFTLKHILFTPWYAARIVKVPSRIFFNALVPSVLAFGAISLSALKLTRVVDMQRFLPLALCVTAMFVVSAIGVYFLALTKEDRSFLSSAVLRKRNGQEST